MVALSQDASIGKVASFFIGVQGMATSPKELLPVSIAELDSWSRQLNDAAQYLRSAVEKARQLGISEILAHPKEVRRNVPSIRKWASNTPGIVDDTRYAQETGTVPLKEQMAIKHQRAKAAKVAKKKTDK